jgi:hypothetical protein
MHSASCGTLRALTNDKLLALVGVCLSKRPFVSVGRSGVLSTAMSFLGLYRDPVMAQVTSRCDWRIRDLVEDGRPATLYLVVPPSDISRTKPLVRLILNQIRRRLTEALHAKGPHHRLLLMLDEFPAVGRLDFFEIGARLHGRLRSQELPDRPVAQSDREGLRCEQQHPGQLACACLFRDERRADRSGSH